LAQERLMGVQMGKILENLNVVLAIGLVAAVGLMFGVHGAMPPLVIVMTWLHVWFGILWIGLLYYFNFVQIPTMPAVPAELKPGVSKYIAPAALFYFRWAALLTVITGLVVAYLYGYERDALTLRPGYALIGIGMWLALVMAFNVWFIIWPNQKKALGIVEADDATKASSARTAMLTSRINTLLSVPMLYAMSAQQPLGG
jgi:uncharacterized membrane protein